MGFFNFHCHSTYSNVSTPDSTCSPDQIIKRTKELGFKAVCISEHGVNTSVWKTAMLCEKEKLKYIYAVEAYFVPDRKEKDNSNTHILLLAKNYDGFKEINKIISQSFTDGFYYKNRIDLELLLSLNPKNVYITTACLANFIGKYEYLKVIEIFEKIYNHFKDSLFLEIQSHITEKQIMYNKKILELANKYNLNGKLILGLDSHAINVMDLKYRDAYLKSKGINYEDEEGYFLTIENEDFYRKKLFEQNVLSQEQIEIAMNNTEYLADNCENLSYIGKHSLKVPTIYPELNQQEKDNKLKEIIMNHPEYKKYSKDLDYEMNEIFKCGMSDYFLINYEIIKLAREKYSGVLTKSGRGSGGAMLLNYILGFTNINRNNFNVPLLSERFLTAERILESKTPPD